MAIIQCSKGHFYDTNKYNNCPHCSKRKQIEEDSTLFLKEQTIYLHDVKMKKGIFAGAADSGKTEFCYDKLKDSNLFSGWLVCIEGEVRGRDYRIYRGFNRIGRSPDSDISIYWDAQVSENIHCSVVYDGKSGCHFLVPGKGTCTYLNRKYVEKSARLEQWDRIWIGKTEMVFIPFCGEGHIWGEQF